MELLETSKESRRNREAMVFRLGRKKVFYLALLIQTSCGLLLSIAPTWWIFALLKAGTGFSQPGIYGVAIVLGMELVGAKYRRLGAVVAGAFYAVGEVGRPLKGRQDRQFRSCSP